MSIDNKVVSMQFDNKQFESAVSNTMSTLDKLKAKLEFRKENANLQALQQAGNSVNFDVMASGIETISNKFSALSIMGITALTNLTNKAVDTGLRMAKALTIEPVTTGFQEYETQINATQTILANTEKEGATITDVNKALDELNKYADLTIYNFTEMTRNIGTFTAAGVKLDTATNAIQGIANLAAVSGSTSQQASTAMYQLSQALSSGTVKLQDWNSVVNAGMGGQVFQDALKETAKVHGVAIDDMIKKEGSFRETLKSGWITSDILTETLQHFTSFTKDYNEETLKAQGYSDEQIKRIKQMGNTATDAATKVKTFTQLWDVLKESAQSGWSGSWKVIIGDFEEAKYTLTQISDELTKVIGAAGDRRISLLKDGLGSGYTKFINDNISNAEAFEKTLQSVAKEHGVDIEKMITDYGSLNNSMKEGWLTEEILHDTILKQNDKKYDKWRETVKKYGKDSKEAQKAYKNWKKIDEEWGAKAENGGLAKMVEQMNQVSGRQHLFNSLWNVYYNIKNGVEAVISGFREFFPYLTGDELYAFTEKLDNLTKSLQLNEDELAAITEVTKVVSSAFRALIDGFKNGFLDGFDLSIFESIREDLLAIFQVFKSNDGSFEKQTETWTGIFSVLQTIAETVLRAFDVVLRVAGTVLTACRPILALFLSIGSAIGNVATKLTDAVDISAIMEKITNGISTAFEKLATVIQAGIKNFIPTVSNAFDIFVNGAERVINAIANLMSSVGFKGLFALLNTTILGGIAIAFKKTFGTITELLKKLTEGGDKKGGLKESIKELFDTVGESLNNFSQSIKANTLLKIAVSLGILAAALTAMGKIDPKALGVALGAMTAAFIELMGAMTGFAVLAGKKSLLTLNQLGVSMMEVAAAVWILAKAMSTLASLDPQSLAYATEAMIALMASLGGFAAAISKIEKFDKTIVTSMVSLAAALLIMATAMKIIGTMDGTQIANSLLGIGGALTEIAIFAGVMSTLEAGVPSIIALATGMLILAGAMKILATMSFEEIVNGLVAIGGALTICCLAAQGMGGGLKGMGLMEAAVAITILATAMKILGSMSLEQITNALVAVGGGLLLMVMAASALSKWGAGGGVAALIAISVALTILAVALKIMDGLEHVKASLIAIGAGLAILIAAAYLAEPVAPAMLAIAGAMVLLGAAVLIASVGVAVIAGALERLAAVPLGALVGSIAALAIGLGLFAAAAALLTPVIPSMIALGAALDLISVAVLIVAKGFTMIVNAIGGIGEAIDKAVAGFQNLKDSTSLIKDAVLDNGKTIKQGAKDFKESGNMLKAAGARVEAAGKEVKKGFKDARKEIEKAGKSLSEAFSPTGSSASKLITNAKKVGSQMGENLASGITKGGKTAASEAKSSSKAIYEAFGTYISRDKGNLLANNMADGLVNGINSNSGRIKAAAKNSAKNAYEAAKNELDINSPSKKFEALGRYSMLGLSQGIEQNARSAELTASKAATRIVTSTNDIFRTMSVDNSVFSAFDNLDFSNLEDLDANPTITPVIDLSNVERGVSAMNGMFGSPTLAIQTAGTIGLGMSRMQNSQNSDILSAIDRLSSVLSDNSGDTYNINGVTYDDGSAINGAVQSIVRAAKIERRV